MTRWSDWLLNARSCRRDFVDVAPTRGAGAAWAKRRVPPHAATKLNMPAKAATLWQQYAECFVGPGLRNPTVPQVRARPLGANRGLPVTSRSSSDFLSLSLTFPPATAR